MDANILRGKKEFLKQRLRILILQNAREGAVYDDKFLMELHHISRELLALRQGNALQEQVVQTKNTPQSVSLLITQT